MFHHPRRLSVLALLLALSSLLLAPAHARAQSSQEEFQQMINVYKQFLELSAKIEAELPDYKKVHEQEFRDKSKEKVVPLLKEMLGCLDQVHKYEPIGGYAELHWIEYRTLLYLYQDSDTIKRIDEGVKATDGELKFESDSVKLCVDFFNAKDDVGRKAAVDALTKIALKRPDRHEVSGATAFMLAVTDSTPIQDQILDLIHNKLSSATAGQIAITYEAPRKLRNAMNKPVVFTYKTWDDQTVQASDYRGKVLMLHFFAVADPKGMKDINKASRIYITNRTKGLEMVGVCCDIDKSELTLWLKEHKHMTWPALFDDFTAEHSKQWHPLTLMLGISKLPSTLLIDRKGVLRYANPEKLEEKVKELLEEKP